MQSDSGIPEEIVHGVGGFPGSKGPIKITKDGEEIGKPLLLYLLDDRCTLSKKI